MARRRIRVSRRSQANRLQLKKTSDFCSSPKVKREARQPPSISIVFALESARLSRWKRGGGNARQSCHGGREMARNAPRAKLILYPDAGHAFLFQYAEDFSDEVLKFLSENENIEQVT